MRKQLTAMCEASQLTRRVDSQTLQPDFGDPVGEEGGMGVEGGLRRDIDDAPTPSRGHEGSGLPDGDEGGAQVDLHDEVVALEGNVEVAHEGDGRVVDEDVEPPELLLGGLDHGDHVVVDRQVGGDRQAAATGRLDSPHRLVERARRALRAGLGGPGRTGHVAARFGQGNRGSGADPPTGPGHQCHLAFEIVHRSRPPHSAPGRSLPAGCILS